MLHLFNRTEIFMTYEIENMQKVCHAFDHHGIVYTMKTTTVEDAYTDEEIKDEHDFDLSVCYKVYVKRSTADEAQCLVKEALFPEE